MMNKVNRGKEPWWKDRKFVLIFVVQIILVLYFTTRGGTPRRHTHEAHIGNRVLFIGIFSHFSHFEERQAIRDTWLKFPLPSKIKMNYKFIIGTSECGGHCGPATIKHEEKLKKEMNNEGRPTSRSELMWATYNWLEANLHFDYFLKTDDDVFFRLDLFYKEISSKPVSKSVWSGFVWRNQEPAISDKESSLYQIDHLPPLAEGYNFYLSEDVVYGLAETKPAVFSQNNYLGKNEKENNNKNNENNNNNNNNNNNMKYGNDEMGQSMALWLLPFNITPIHDPRFQCGDMCSDKLFQKCKLAPDDVRGMYKEAIASRSPCDLYANQQCPVCMECTPFQRHWKLSNIQCDSDGAIKRTSENDDSDTQRVLGFLPVLQCDYQKLEDTESGLNFVKDGRAPSANNWVIEGEVQTTTDSDRGTPDECVQITSFFYSVSYISQEIEMKQTHAEAIVISGWSKADAVGQTQKGDYSIMANITFSDGTTDDAIVIDFDSGTHDWQYASKIYHPSLPISRITLRCMLRFVQGVAWFDNISVMTLGTSLCTLKHQSSLFGDFQSSSASLNYTLSKFDQANTIFGTDTSISVDSHIPMQDYKSRVSKSGTSRFFFVWTSPADSFKLRNRRSLESVFFHHPDAHVTVYANFIPLNFFHEFNSAGYDVQVVSYNLQELVEGMKGQKWAKEIDKWSNGPYFYSHNSDFLKFVILYRYGGVYMDFDMILMKPFTTKNTKNNEKDGNLNLIPAEVCGSKTCVQPGDDSIQEKYYVPTGFISMEAGHPLIASTLSLFDRSYDPNTKHAGALCLSIAYSNNSTKLTDVTMVPFKAVYPIPEKEIAKYFKQDNFERWKSIQTAEPYTFHFWGTETRDLEVSDSSLMKRVLSEFSISNTRDKSGL